MASCQTSLLGICTASSRFIMKAVTPRRFPQATPSLRLSMVLSFFWDIFVFLPLCNSWAPIFQDSWWLIGEPPEPPVFTEGCPVINC